MTDSVPFVTYTQDTPTDTVTVITVDQTTTDHTECVQTADRLRTINTAQVVTNQTLRSELWAFKTQVRDHVIATAIEKEWCVTGTNRHLEACGLEEWEGPTTRYEVELTVIYSTTVEVEATSEEDASELAADQFDSSDIRYDTPDIEVQGVSEC